MLNIIFSVYFKDPSDHKYNVKKSRTLIQDSKKVDCKASITVRDVVFFREFKVMIE